MLSSFLANFNSTIKYWVMTEPITGALQMCLEKTRNILRELATLVRFCLFFWNKLNNFFQKAVVFQQPMDISNITAVLVKNYSTFPM